MWQESDIDGGVCLVFTGDPGPAQVVEAAFIALHEAIVADPRRVVVIDAALIERISSLAIAQLIATVRAVDMVGGRIAMIHAHPFVANVLRTMRIVKVLPLFDDLTAAVDHLRALRET